MEEGRIVDIYEGSVLQIMNVYRNFVVLLAEHVGVLMIILLQGIFHG